MQMAIIWWLTALVFIMLGGNRVFLSFKNRWMNYPVVFLSLSSSSSSLSSFGLSLATHVRKKLRGRETRWPQVPEGWRHWADFVSCDLSALNPFSHILDVPHWHKLKLQDADYWTAYCISRLRKSLNYTNTSLKLVLLKHNTVILLFYLFKIFSRRRNLVCVCFSPKILPW